MKKGRKCWGRTENKKIGEIKNGFIQCTEKLWRKTRTEWAPDIDGKYVEGSRTYSNGLSRDSFVEVTLVLRKDRITVHVRVNGNGAPLKRTGAPRWKYKRNNYQVAEQIYLGDKLVNVLICIVSEHQESSWTPFQRPDTPRNDLKFILEHLSFHVELGHYVDRPDTLHSDRDESTEGLLERSGVACRGKNGCRVFAIHHLTWCYK